MKKVIIVAIGAIFIAGCSNIFKPKKAEVITTKHCKLDQFKSIVVSGNANVELVKGTPAIEIKGTNTDKYDCQNLVMNQVLTIKNLGSKTSVTNIKLTTSGLRDITVTNNATVNAKYFKANNLTVIAKDHGNINLEGWYNINQIYQLGRGRINIDWIDSDALRIEGNANGPIYLAGIVNNMTVKLVNDANLNARYLRAQKASVFTTNKALAEVLVLDILKAFAIDNSNIYYYKRPKNITIVTKHHGNILHPDWIR